MTPLPKRRQSRGRTRRRRAHDAIHQLNLVECPTCRAMRRPHTVCPACGTYKGKAVVDVDES